MPICEVVISCDNLLCDGHGRPPNPTVIVQISEPNRLSWIRYGRTEVIEVMYFPEFGICFFFRLIFCCFLKKIWLCFGKTFFFNFLDFFYSCQNFLKIIKISQNLDTNYFFGLSRDARIRNTYVQSYFVHLMA